MSRAESSAAPDSDPYLDVPPLLIGAPSPAIDGQDRRYGRLPSVCVEDRWTALVRLASAFRDLFGASVVLSEQPGSAGTPTSLAVTAISLAERPSARLGCDLLRAGWTYVFLDDHTPAIIGPAADPRSAATLVGATLGLKIRL